MSLVTWYKFYHDLLYVWWTFSFMIQHKMTWIYTSNTYICVYIMFKGSYIWILVSQSFEICCKTLKRNKLSTLWERFRAKSLFWPGQMYPVLSVVPSLPCTLFLKTRCFPCFDISCSCQNYGGNPEHMAMSQDASLTLFINLCSKFYCASSNEDIMFSSVWA